MPITEAVLETTTLGRAINKASDETIRAVLKSICPKNDEARKEAESQLLVLTDSEGGSVKIPSTTKSEPTGEELWEDNYGEFDVEDFRDDWPECFTFACCHGNLRDNPDGCVFNFHQELHADGKPSKRARAY
ncbi:hypothetical protein N7490_002765 [Penicillium lividum]|nr:hypothetical protein N7490_002765 [Penicillium lividum]